MENTDKSFWWEANTNEVHKLVEELVNHLSIKQAQKTEDNLRNLRLYGNTEVLGLRFGEFGKVKSLNKLTLNVIQATIDTATARIAKSKPKPMFLTDDGDFGDIKKAQNLTSYVYGQFYHMDLYEKGQKIFRDGGVFGDGFIKFIEDKGKFSAERVFPEEILVDDDEAMYGEPQQMHQVKYVSKQKLMRTYKKYKLAIKNSGLGTSSTFMYSKHTPDMVRVVESWYLANSEGKGGRHAITIDKADLLDEKYTKDYFPFEKWSYNERLIGYWSQGISEVLTGIQIEMNKILKTIQVALHLGAVPKIFVEEGSKVVKAHLNNQIGGIINYRGTIPKEGTLMSIPPELFLSIDRLYQKAFEMIGLSQLSATGQKPVGLDSGKAIRTQQDVETERFAVLSQRWEGFYMRCSKKIIRMSRDAAKDNPKMAITALDRNRMKTIKWADVDLEEDKYIMKQYPTNLLADTPSGKWADVKEMMEVGFLDKRQASSLLDYPDLEAVTSLDNALMDDFRGIVEDITEEGIYNPPEPFQDLEWMIPMMQSSYLKYKRSKLDISRLELFARWIDDAMVMISPEPEVMIDETEITPEEMELAEVPVDELAEMELEPDLMG